MRRSWSAAALTGLLALAAGCGGSAGLVPVSGTVRLDGQPLAQASLRFVPDGDARTHWGTALTGADGKYRVMGPQGQDGLAPGPYKVTVSRLLRKDGTPPPANVPPIESDATESLPAIYSHPDRTTLKVTVEPGKSVDLDLTSAKKK